MANLTKLSPDEEGYWRIIKGKRCNVVIGARVVYGVLYRGRITFRGERNLVFESAEMFMVMPEAAIVEVSVVGVSV